MIRGFRQVAFLTVISRILGMVRDMAFAYYFGRGDLMDTWVIAFKIPNLARRIFGEGAAATSFIPVYSEMQQKDPARAVVLARTVVTAITVLLSGLVLLGWLVLGVFTIFFADLPSTERMLNLTSLMLPYMVLICTVAMLGGILNSHRHFASPAFAPALLNIFMIGSLFISGSLLDWPGERMVYFVAGGVVAAGIAQVFHQLLALKKIGISIRPAWQIRTEGFHKILYLMGPMILGLTATQINTLADDLIARWFSGSAEKGETFVLLGQTISYPLWAGSVSSLFYAQRLYQFPLGVLGISLATVIYPVMSENAAKNDRVALVATITTGIRAAVFVALPATAGLILVARPLMSVIFQRGQFTAEDTAQTTGVLIFYSIGLLGYFCQQLVTRAFYAFQDSKMPAHSAIWAVGVNIVLNLTLIWFMGAAGLAFSTALCSYLQVAILIWKLKRRYGLSVAAGFRANFLKPVVNTVLMTAIGYAILLWASPLPQNTRFDLLRLLAVVGGCSLAYLAGAKLMKDEMLSLIIRSRRREGGVTTP